MVGATGCWTTTTATAAATTTAITAHRRGSDELMGACAREQQAGSGIFNVVELNVRGRTEAELCCLIKNQRKKDGDVLEEFHDSAFPAVRT